MVDNSDIIWSTIIDNIYIDKVYHNGFNMTKCNVCNDYKFRGGFKYEDNKIIYNCFNCGTSAVLDTSFKGIPQRFLNVLESFFDNSVINEIKTLLLLTGESSSSNITTSNKKTINFIELPKDAKHICDNTYNYLKNKRGINPDLIEVYNYEINGNIYVLFPVRDRGNRLVCWNARLLQGLGERYITHGEKKSILYNMNVLYNKDIHRIYVTDGIMDCLSIYPYAVSTLGSTINNDMIQQLKNTNKQIVLIVDNDSQGGKLGQVFLNNNFNIAKINSKYKDLNQYYCSLNFNKILLLQNLNFMVLDPIEAKYHIDQLIASEK